MLIHMLYDIKTKGIFCQCYVTISLCFKLCSTETVTNFYVQLGCQLEPSSLVPDASTKAVTADSVTA